MQSKADTPFAEWFLATATLLVLFVGTFKGLVPSPIDLSVVTLGLMCLALLPYWRTWGEFDRVTGILLAGVIIWSALRMFPEPSAWGIRKMVEAVAIGLPVALAGSVIGKRIGTQQAIMAILSWVAVPVTAYLLFHVAEHPRSFGSIGSGNYQHTGLLLAFGMIASAASGRFILLAIATLGCVLTGHISGVLFGTLAAGVVLLSRRAWAETAKASMLFVAMIATYSAFVAPPVIVSRVATKMDRVVAFSERAPVLVSPTVTAPAPASSVREILDTPKAQPAEAAKLRTEKFDRAEIQTEGIKRFMEQPLFGWGFGKADYRYTIHPHNIIIELGAETGIIGGLLVVGLLFAAARSSMRNPFALGIFLLVAGFAMVSGYFGSRYLMFAFGLAAGCSPLSLLTWARNAQPTRIAADAIGTP